MGTFLSLCLVLIAALWPGQSANDKTAGNELNDVLTQMDASASSFKSAEADFVLQNYQKVVNETSTQKGRMYFRRKNSSAEVMFNITSPVRRQILFKDGILGTYEEGIDRHTRRKVQENSREESALMSLGFGARGADLTNNFQVNMKGWESLQGQKTAKLELIPASARLRGTFSRLILWINPQNDAAMQVQAYSPSGDYWLATLQKIKLNHKISEDAFRFSSSTNSGYFQPR